MGTVPQPHRGRVDTQTGWYHLSAHIFWPDAFLQCSHCPYFSGGERWDRTSRRICPWRGCRWVTHTIHTWLGRHRRAPLGLKRAQQTPAGRRWSDSVCDTGPYGRSWCRVRRRTTGRSQRWSHKYGQNCRSRATDQRQKGRAPHRAAWWKPSRAGRGSASSGTTPQTSRPGSQTESRLAPPEDKDSREREVSQRKHLKIFMKMYDMIYKFAALCSVLKILDDFPKEKHKLTLKMHCYMHYLQCDSLCWVRLMITSAL